MVSAQPHLLSAVSDAPVKAELTDRLSVAVHLAGSSHEEGPPLIRRLLLSSPSLSSLCAGPSRPQRVEGAGLEREPSLWRAAELS